jgi:chromate transporter
MILVLLQLAGLFALLSLLAFGGGAGVLPDMQRAAEAHGWVTAHEFLDMFAISRAAPGPGSQIVVLIGQKAAGLPGAAVAFLAMFLPSSLLVYLAAHVWHRAARAAWRRVVERALAPVAIGMTFASGLALMRSTEHAWPAYAVTIAATLAFAFTELHPVAMLAAGAAVLLAVAG